MRKYDHELIELDDKYGTHTAVLGADGGKDNPKFNMGIVGTPPDTHG